MDKAEFDVVIVGGGLNGGVLAQALAGSGINYALIDNSDLSKTLNPTLDNRGIALSSTTIEILQQLDLWDSITNFATNIAKVHISEQGCFGTTILEDNARLGALVSIDSILQSIYNKLPTISNLTLESASVIDFSQDNNKNHIELKTSNNKLITTKLIIAADGTNSFFRNKLNIQARIFDYKQNAIVTTVEFDKSHNNIAYERFIKTGSLALLPFGNNKMKCILILQQDKSAYWLNCKDTEFLNKIKQHMGTRVGIPIKLSKRINYPLKEVKSTKIFTDRVVFLGNAVNTINPIAAQGFNLAIRDVMVLAKFLQEAKAGFLDFGCYSLLSRYASLRQPDHNNTTGATHILATLYNSDAFLMRQARRIANIFSAISPTIKNKIANIGQGVEFYEH